MSAPRVPWIAAIAIAVALMMGGCKSRTQPSGAGLTPTPTVTAPGASPSAAPGVGGKAVLSNGAAGYTYRPQIAYIDPSQALWLVNADGSGRVKLLDGCTGIGSAKQGNVVTGGLAWSADGSRIACWRNDLSVLTAKADGTERATAFQAGECSLGPQWAPAGELIACDVQGVVSVREPGGRQRSTMKGDLGGAWSWSPSGSALLVSGGPKNNHGTWNVFTSSGAKLAEIADAYVASPAGFEWSLDGTKIAYPGMAGITLVDLAAGGTARSYQPPAESGLELTGGPQVDFVMHDTALLAHGYSGAALVDLATGALTTVAGFPQGSFWAARIAPDGLHVAFAGPSSGAAQRISIGDLQAHSVAAVAGSDYTLQGIGPSPQFVFSGDSRRVCWTPRPSNQPEVSCASVGGAAAKVVPPVQVEPDVLGRGDPSVLWQGLSPDLARVASTAPGLTAPTSPQTLQLANVDGSAASVLGAALGPLTYSWRPDGVYRAPVRN